MALIINLILLLSCSLLLIGCNETTPNSMWQHDSRGLYAAAFSKYGEKLIIASVDKSAQLWDFANNKKIHTWTHQTGASTDIAHVAISYDGNIAVTAENKAIVVWNAITGKSIGYWQLPNFITNLSISQDGKYALIAYANRSVQLLNLQDGFSVWQAQHNAYIETIELSLDHNYAVVGCDDNTITLWNITESKRDFLWQDKSRIRYAGISHNNNYSVSSSPFQPIKIWDNNSGKLKYSLKLFSGVLSYFSRDIIHISKAVFSDDSKLLAIGAPPRNAYLWDLTTGTLKQKFYIPKDKIWKPTSAIVYGLAFSANKDKLLVEASNGAGYSFLIN